MPAVANNTSPEQSKLVMSCQGLVRNIAWKIHRKVSATHVELDDLIAYGQLGLIEAANNFDASRGHQFTTFAYYRIRGAILDGLSKMNWFQHSDFARGQYEVRASDALASGDNSNADDLTATTQSAQKLGVIYLFCQFAKEPVGVSGQRDPEEHATIDELKSRLHKMIGQLDETEQQLIKATYFEGMSLKDAAEMMGHSKSWGSRLHARILQRFASELCVAD